MLFFKASGATAIRALFTLLNKENKPVILLGPSNTAALEPVAESAKQWKLVQVWTSTLLLSSRMLMFSVMRQNE